MQMLAVCQQWISSWSIEAPSVGSNRIQTQDTTVDDDPNHISKLQVPRRLVDTFPESERQLGIYFIALFQPCSRLSDTILH